MKRLTRQFCSPQARLSCQPRLQQLLTGPHRLVRPRASSNLLPCLIQRRLCASNVPLPQSEVPPSFPVELSPSSADRADANPNAILDYPFTLVNTTETLTACATALRGAKEVAVDVEALVTSGDAHAQLGQLSLVQLCSDAAPMIYIVDVLTLGVAAFAQALGPLFTDNTVRKSFFDCRRDVEALACQAGIRPQCVLDLQLYYTAMQWRLRSVNRRSGMPYVLKAVTSIERQESDSAVHLAMTCGARPVWDIRPLAAHFLEYAADDVRHTYILRTAFAKGETPQTATQDTATGSAMSRVPLDAVARLTAHYVAHYATGTPVTQETDTRPAEVNVAFLERYIGPGGVCAFCHAKGHTETECFQKNHVRKDQAKYGPQARSTGAARPQTDKHGSQKQNALLKCVFCGRLGHNEANCFKKQPCKHCGGEHRSEFCRHRLHAAPFFNFQNKRSEPAE